MTDDWLPPHPYVPGRTPRHPEGLFDTFKQGLDGLDHRDLNRSAAWNMGLRFLAQGFYWECHELLEAVWMRCPPNSAERKLVQAIIQRSNARLKAAMGRPKAAERLESMADGLVAEAFSQQDRVLGLVRAEVLNL